MALGRKTGGRVKGTPNKTTSELRAAILRAAELVGEDGSGKDGLTGYLVRVARDDVKAFSGLLGKVLPMQMTGEDGGPIQLVPILNITVGQDRSTTP